MRRLNPARRIGLAREVAFQPCDILMRIIDAMKNGSGSSEKRSGLSGSDGDDSVSSSPQEAWARTCRSCARRSTEWLPSLLDNVNLATGLC